MKDNMTAVEWLENEIKTKEVGVTPQWLLEDMEQAKEMEKQQIIDACKYGNNFEQGDLRCEVYYNKTFKSE